MKNLIFLGTFLVAAAMIVGPVNASAYATSGAYKITDSGALGGGGATGSTSNNQPSPAPACSKPIINYITPDSAFVGTPAQNVAVVGSCFTPSSQVTFNSQYRNTTFVDANKLIVRLEAADKAVIGKYLVTVYEQTVQQHSNSAFFTVLKKTSTTKSVAKKTTPKTVATVVKSEETKCEPDATLAVANTDDKIDLTGNALMAFLGSATFMPNTLLGWIFLFIAVLLLVKLWRKLYVTDKERNTPLKHA